MQNMIRSMARFSAAMTLFGFQQFQNVLNAVADSADALKVRESLDAVTDAIASELDKDTKPAYDSMVRLSNQVVDRTFDTMKRAQRGGQKSEADGTTEPAENSAQAAASPPKAADVELPAD